MKKLGLTLGLLLLVVLTLSVSCAAPQAVQKVTLLCAAGPVDWTTYPATVGMADIANRNTNLNITVRSYSGSLTILQALIAKETSLATGQRNQHDAMAYDAWDKFKDLPPARDLRSVINFMEISKSVNVRGDSNIKTIADLKGRRVARYTAQPFDFETAILKMAGLDTTKDVIWVDMPGTSDSVKEMRMGRIDAAYFDLQGAGTLELADAIKTIRPLPIDSEILNKVATQDPRLVAGFTAKMIQPGWASYLDVTKPTPVLFSPMFFSTRADVSENAIYAFTKVLIDKAADVKVLTDELKPFGPDLIKTPSSIPYHPGAIKALKEAKMWTDGMEQANQAALKR